MTTSGAITERVNKFGAIKGSIFQGIPGTEQEESIFLGAYESDNNA